MRRFSVSLACPPLRSCAWVLSFAGLLGCAAAGSAPSECRSLSACCASADFPSAQVSECQSASARGDAETCRLALDVYRSAALCGPGPIGGGSGTDGGEPNDGGESQTDGGGTGTADGGGLGGASTSVRIVTFSSTAAQLLASVELNSPDQPISFVAIVTDSNGLDTLAGGTLTDLGGATYGGFQTGAQRGTYEITLTWNQINQISPINVPPNGKRAFIATFYDNSGASASAELDIGLDCLSVSSYLGVCGGACADYAANSSCGGCSPCPGNTNCTGSMRCNSAQGVISACSFTSGTTNCNEYCASVGKTCINSSACQGGAGLDFGFSNDCSGQPVSVIESCLTEYGGVGTLQAAMQCCCH